MGFEQRHTAITSAKSRAQDSRLEAALAGGVIQQILQGKPAEDEEPPGWRGRKKVRGPAEELGVRTPERRIPDLSPDQKIGERQLR